MVFINSFSSKKHTIIFNITAVRPTLSYMDLFLYISGLLYNLLKLLMALGQYSSFRMFD